MSIQRDVICGALAACTATTQRLLEFEPEGESRGYADDATWILTSSFVILTMQTGFALLEMGSSQAGFEVNILMKNVVDVVFGSLSFYILGYGIAFGNPSNPFMGLGDFAPDAGGDATKTGLLFSRYIFQLSFAATSTTIVSGCVAMRMKFLVYCAYSFFAIIFYGFVAHWVFAGGGWLSNLGVHDFAGGGPVHLFGGTSGLIAILFVGARRGRFDGSRPESDFLPVSQSSILFGLFMLWWGWIGFNCGSSFGITDSRWVVATRCAVTTINSTSAGGICAIIISLMRTKGRFILTEDVADGILGALVAITPTCATVQTYVAFPIGAIGALVALGTNKLLLRFKIDDPVGAVGVHAFSGMWGLFAVGLFADSELAGVDVRDGLLNGGGFYLLGVQCLAIVAIIGWAVAFATTFFYSIGVMIGREPRNPRRGLRISAEEEMCGADHFLHGIDLECMPPKGMESDHDADNKEVGMNASAGDDSGLTSSDWQDGDEEGGLGRVQKNSAGDATSEPSFTDANRIISSRPKPNTNRGSHIFRSVHTVRQQARTPTQQIRRESTGLRSLSSRSLVNIVSSR